MSNRFGLLMCCNYPNTPYRLYGCINDGNAIYNLLVNTRGFKPADITKVYDKSMTYDNMLSELKKFAKRTYDIGNKGQIPECVLYYSGHGVRVPPTLKKELIDDILVRNSSTLIDDKDGDECLVPYNFNTAGLIKDDMLFSEFVSKLHPKTQLFIMTDCCNSGTNFDLKYQKLVNLYNNNGIDASIIQLAGCQDDQASAEIYGGGILTTKFINIMTKEYNKITSINSFQDIFKDVSTLWNRQHPQVSLSNERLFNTNLFPWLLNPYKPPEPPKRPIKVIRKNGKIIIQFSRNIKMAK